MITKKLILLLLLTSLFAACQHDELVQKGTVQFSFNSIDSPKAGGRKQIDQIPNGASLILTLTKPNGDSVFTWKKFDLLKIGDQFITNPLPLLSGGYVITDFMIIGPDNNLLFIAPKQGSPLATLVSKTIPFAFNINANEISNVSVEVVDANHQTPEDFGYASFPIHVVPSSGFAVTVFVTNENGATNLTTAHAYILHGEDSILSKKLLPSTNYLNWVKGANTRFSLIIIKDGYGRYEKEFDLDSMMTELNGQPLAVLLTPAATVTWTNWNASGGPVILLNGTPGSKVNIDWGDKSGIETITFPHTDGVGHVYAEAKKYFFSITGDLPSVKQLDISFSAVEVDTLSITHLPQLTRFGISFVPYDSREIDFSHNPKLDSIIAVGIEITQFDISKNPRLIMINIPFAMHLTTATINKAIDDLYASVILNNRRNGVLYLRTSYLNHSVVGSPSPDQIQKLYSLINDYGWYVEPL